MLTLYTHKQLFKPKIDYTNLPTLFVKYFSLYRIILYYNYHLYDVFYNIYYLGK